MKARPLLRYYGGKFRLSKWIISHFPKHRIYVEAFGGAGSILLQKEKSYAEVYNDLDGEIVNLFRVSRDNGEELKRSIELTPFARKELAEAYAPAESPIEQARRTIIKSLMGFGSNAIHTHSGFRGCANRSYTIPAHDWKTYPEALEKITTRLKGVIIESHQAAWVLKKYDTKDTLHYVDPPYLPETRVPGKKYRFEMTREDHVHLASVLRGLKGKVVLSGYNSDLYNTLYRGWEKSERAAWADGARPRMEVLWIKPNNGGE
jgi:DNA adenine methylase